MRRQRADHARRGRRAIGQLTTGRCAPGHSRARAAVDRRGGDTLQSALDRLRASEQRYDLTTEVATDGLFDWDLGRNEIRFSRQWKAQLGFEDPEIGASSNELFVRVHPEDVERIHLEIAMCLEGKTPRLETRHRLLHKDGSYRWMLLRGVVAGGADGSSHMFGAHSDVTDRRAAEAQLERKAFYDSLTDLPNRALFMDRVWRAVENAKRRKSYLFAVLFLDLDRFKIVNDSLGHLVGDELLVATARRLEGCLRQTDTLARLGGDEFAILLDHTVDPHDAQLVADRIQRDLAKPFDIQGHSVFSSVSIGIALSTAGYERPEDLLRDADIAMYRAKAGGKARSEVYDSAMHAEAMKLMQLESELRRAIERNEFELYYQPIVSLKTGRVESFEALVRWMHPVRGLVPPGDFIPFAEETGLIIALDRLVLFEACRQMREWQDRHVEFEGMPLSVNLSSHQFRESDLLEFIAQTLADTGLDSRCLKIEITESALMEEGDAVATAIEGLKAMGIRLLIDDFGTGYSSLSYMCRFPIDVLKIDRAFVGRMGEGKNLEIVRTIVTLAHNLGLGVVAEGIETLEQVAGLQALACEYGQGYHFARPLDAAAAEALVVAEALYGGYFGGALGARGSAVAA